MKIRGMKWFTSILIVVLITGLFPVGGINLVDANGNSSQFEAGSGTEADPYLIRTLDQFNHIRDRHAEGEYFKLIADIELFESNNTWSTIGNEETQLKLDGNGHTITLNNPLFSNIIEPIFHTLGTDSNVKDLMIVVGDVYYTSDSYAALAINNEGFIDNVHVRFNPFSSRATNFFGGLVVHNKSKGSITRSSVLTSNIFDIHDNRKAALFVLTNDGVISQSNTESALQFTVFGSNEVSGFVGTNTGIISDSYAQGSLSVQNTTDTLLAGFVTTNAETGVIRSSYYEGLIYFPSFTNYEEHYVGGFAASNQGTIEQSYVVGTILYEDYFEENNERNLTIGGFSAINTSSGSISESYTNINFYYRPVNKDLSKRITGFVAENNGQVESSYYSALPEEEYYEKDHSANEVDPYEFYKMESFPDWDFVHFWSLDGASYPVFRPSYDILIDESVQAINAGSSFNFTATATNIRPPFNQLEANEMIYWTVDSADEYINVQSFIGKVTVGLDTAVEEFTLRAAYYENQSFYKEMTIKVVQPKVLGFSIDAQHTTLDAPNGAGQGGDYTIAFITDVEGGADPSYTLEAIQEEYIKLSPDSSGLFYNVHIEEDAPIGTYSLLVTSNYDESQTYEYEFDVVEPYRQFIGLKQDDKLISATETQQHYMNEEHTYELEVIDHGNVTSTPPSITVSGKANIIEFPMPMNPNAVIFSGNKLIIDDSAKNTLAGKSIYLHVRDQSETIKVYELSLSNLRFEINNTMLSELYTLVGNEYYHTISFKVRDEGASGQALNVNLSSTHPEIAPELISRYWNSYDKSYVVSIGVRTLGTVPVGDYSITVSLNEKVQQSFPISVKSEVVESISTDVEKVFVPRNIDWNMDSIFVPVQLELADDITNFHPTRYQPFVEFSTLDGQPYEAWFIPSLQLVMEDGRTYIEITDNSYIEDLPLGTVLNVRFGLQVESSKYTEFQIVFNEIDEIDIKGLDDESNSLYAFVGDSTTLEATVKSTNHTIEGFPVPQDIYWELEFPSDGATINQGGVFMLDEEIHYLQYTVNATAKGGFSKQFTILPARVTSVVAATNQLQIRAGDAAELEVQVKSNYANFYSTTKFTVDSTNAGITYVDGQVMVDEDVEPGTYTITFISTIDTTKSATVTIQVGGPSAVEVQPDPIVIMPGGTDTLVTEFTGSGDFTQAGVWDTKGIPGLTVTKTADTQHELSVASNVQPNDYTITFKHEDYTSVAKDVTVQVYDITGITGVENVYHLNQGQELTLNPSVVAVNAEGVAGINELSFSNSEAFTVNDSGKLTIKPNAATGKHTLTITSVYKGSVKKTVDIYVTSIDSVTIVGPEDSPLAYQAGDSIQLSAAVEVTGQVSEAVIWSSSNEAKVSVDEDGLVTIKAGAEPGNYTITATSVIDARKSDSVTIEVGKVTGITVDKETVYLQAGEETTVTATVDVIGPLSTDVDWGSDDEEVTVNSQGEITVSTSADPGTYRVHATSSINEQFYVMIDVEVFELEDIEIATIPSIYKGTSYELEYDIVVAGEHGDRIIDEVVWSIHDEEGAPVAGVTVDEDNVIHVASTVAAGKYELRAQSSVNSQVSSSADLYITSIDAVQIDEPSKTVLQEGDSMTLTADVTATGDVSTDVVWDVAGPSELVTINAQGELTVLEDAEVGTYTVIATSSVDASQFATLLLEVAKVTSVEVDQNWVKLQPGGSVTLSASAIVEGSLSSDVNWSSSDSDNISIIDGLVTIHPSAPAGNYAVRISSVANPSVKAEVTIQVFTIIGINVSESEFTLNQGKSAAFSTTVNGTNAIGVAGFNNVTFEYENSNVYVENGEIVVGENVAAGMYTITVKAALNESITKEVTVHVTSINSVSIGEVSQAVLQAGESFTLAADVSVSGEVSDAIIWSVAGPSEFVTINAQGELTVQEGAATGNYTVTATSAVDSRKSDSVGIEVAEVTGITVDQAKVALRAGKSVTVAGSATVTGNLSTAVEWSSLDEEVTVDNGTITVDPAALTGMYEVKVTSVANPDVSEIVTVQVYRIVGITLSQNEFTINQGNHAALSYTVETENGEDVEGADLVTYHSENNDITVNEYGEIVVDEDAVSGSNFNIRVQSVKDPSVSSNITVHITSIDAVTASINELNLYQGEQGAVSVQVEASGEVSRAIAWESSSPSIEVLETDEEGKFSIKAAINAPTGTHTVKAYSEVDGRKFAEIKVKVSRKSSPTPETTPLEPVEPEVTVPTEPGEPTDPAPTAPVDTTEVLKTELVDRNALVDGITEKIKASTAPQFTDMAGHWANEVVTKGAQLGMTNGYQDGSFKPDSSITRAEFVKMLANILPVQRPSEVKSFDDITTHWAKNEIELFASLGIINGYGNGNFAPNQTISREEMVIIVARLLNFAGVVKDATKGQFADLNEVSSYAQQVVVNAAQAGIINGKGDNTFAPKAQATRAEALTVIINMLSLDPQLAELLK